MSRAKQLRLAATHYPERAAMLNAAADDLYEMAPMLRPTKVKRVSDQSVLLTYPRCKGVKN